MKSWQDAAGKKDGHMQQPKDLYTPGMKSWEDAKIKQLRLHKIPDYDPKHRNADAAKEA
jgi:hypothetical protein